MSLYIISFIKNVLTPLVFLTTSSAISSARGNTSSALSHVSENKPPQIGSSARYVAPVVTTCMARECPINRGRKKELQASMTSPRRAKTNPIFADADAMRMFMGSVMVMPIPTAEPWMAPIVGLREWWIARTERPPLCCVGRMLIQYFSFLYSFYFNRLTYTYPSL